MRYFICSLCIAIALSSCDGTQEEYKNKMSDEPTSKANEKTAVFAEGCFWHSELVFQSLEGVRDALSGYAGGSYPDPNYERVSTGETGHAEAIKVYYDPSKISYKQLVRVFFASHDPTSLNRQGQDVGTEYRSIAFYNTADEKQVIEAEIDSLKTTKKYSNPIVTEVLSLKKFYPAEEFHQEYVHKHPDNDYVKYVTIPEFIAFKLDFEAAYKKEWGMENVKGKMEFWLHSATKL